MPETEQILQDLKQSFGDISTAIVEIRDKSGNNEEALNRAVADLAETQKSIQALEAQARVDAEHRDKLEERYDELAGRIGHGVTGGQVSSEHHDAFMAFVGGGLNAPNAADFYHRSEIQDLQKRTLTGTNWAEGGALLDGETEAGIIKDVVENSPVMQLARVTTLAAGSAWWEKRVRSSGMTGYWVGESERPTETSSKYTTVTITPHAAAAACQVTNRMLADVGYLEEEIRLDAAEALDVLIGTAFVTGNGAAKPRGFTIPGDVPFVTGTDAATDVIDPDDFYKLLYGKGGADQSGLSARYRANATFAMNSNVLRKVVLFKDDSNRYLFQDGFREGAFSRIAGQPFVILEDMADDGTNANIPLALADWQAFYRIVVKPGMYMIRDIYSAKPDVELDWYWRVGGDVIQAEAGRLLVV